MKIALAGDSAGEGLAHLLAEHLKGRFDVFEVSNLNRQLFATLDTVGRLKAEAARTGALKINPQVEVEVLGAEWTDRLDDILPKVAVVVNGTDDAADRNIRAALTNSGQSRD